MPQPNDLSRSLVALDQDSTIIAVVEMSQSSWLVAGMLPGIERQPRKKLEPSAERLLGLRESIALTRRMPVGKPRPIRMPDGTMAVSETSTRANSASPSN